MRAPIFEGLNEEQRSAVEATRGPVCILAGAGSGKTTTITRRIANQVASGVFRSQEILAVTFTDKAAGGMARRLEALGVPGVRARTFHAEALAQYRRFSKDESELLPAKAPLLTSLVRSLPPPHRFTALRDFATAIEWAKNRRITPERYLEEVGERRTPVPAEFMARIYVSYEKRKARAKMLDFEDLLEKTIGLLESDPSSLEEVRSKYLAFTVDEYQDVNLLQETLLQRWAGDRDELCVVGDDYQSIFGFTGATPRYLLGFSERYPACEVIRLTANYRSTPPILEVANRLVPRLGGSHKTLRAIAKEGPAPVFRSFFSGGEEAAWVASEAQRLNSAGIPWERIAILYRINARSDRFEEEFAQKGIPFQVRDSAFLRRPAARSLLARVRRTTGPVSETVAKLASDLGYRGDSSDDLDGDEATRQADFARLIRLAEEYPGPEIPGFVADLQDRFGRETEGRGVHLMTYHRAKGLEFDAVFLPRLEDRELPFALASGEELGEERRLFYVGITRAKRRLFISWTSYREDERVKHHKPSPFLAEIGALSAASRDSAGRRPRAVRTTRQVAPEHRVLFDALKEWRSREARATAVPAYVVFADETLARIAELRPRDFGALLDVPGIGPAKSAKYGIDVLALVTEHSKGD